MVRYEVFGFSADYRGLDHDFSEFDEFLQREFKDLPAGWEPTFGKVSYFDADVKDWRYKYLLTGNVPEATSSDDAARKADHLVSGLTGRFKQAHANPGTDLSEPVVKIWRLI